MPRDLREGARAERAAPLERARRPAGAVGLPDDRYGPADPAAQGQDPLGFGGAHHASRRLARPEPRRCEPPGLRHEHPGRLLGPGLRVRRHGPHFRSRRGPGPPRRPRRGRGARPLSGRGAPLDGQAQLPRSMSHQASTVLPANPLRVSLTLAAVVLGLVALTVFPAHALEKKVFGDVVVEPGESESEVSTAVGDITVEGFVVGDVRSARGDVEVGGEGVGGDIKAGSGDVEVLAPVGGKIDAGFGDVYVNAAVGGDVEVGRGDVELGPEASVGGDLHYGSGEFSGNPEAVQGTMRGGGMGPGMDHNWGGDGVLDLVGWAFAAALFAACSVLAAVLDREST